MQCRYMELLLAVYIIASVVPVWFHVYLPQGLPQL